MAVCANIALYGFRGAIHDRRVFFRRHFRRGDGQRVNCRSDGANNKLGFICVFELGDAFNLGGFGLGKIDGHTFFALFGRAAYWPRRKLFLPKVIYLFVLYHNLLK